MAVWCHDSATFKYHCYIFSNMEQDTVATVEVGEDAEVMASVEGGERETFIVADVSRDDAYLTLPLAEAMSLPAWR